MVGLLIGVAALGGGYVAARCSFCPRASPAARDRTRRARMLRGELSRVTDET